MAQLSSGKRLTITESKPFPLKKDDQSPGTAPSILNVHCPKACTVSIDGTRKGPAQSQRVVIHGLAPGEHHFEVKFVLGTKVVRSRQEIPSGSEVFATAIENGFHITNTRPLEQ